MEATDLAGWIGAISFLVSYGLVSSGIVEGRSRTYQLLNLFGAVGVGINVFAQEAWPTLVLECLWGAIAIWTLMRLGKSNGLSKTRS